MGIVERARACRASLDELIARQEQSAAAAAAAFVCLAQSEQMGDEAVAALPGLFPLWSEGWTGGRGAIVREGERLYRALHDVGPGQNTRPSLTPAMWAPVGHPAQEYPDWVQPLGGHDAYPSGARVSHKGRRWINSHGDGNIWEPSVYGWTEVT